MTAVLVGGESDQLRALHDRHGHALWSYAVGLTGGDRGKAQDVVQETLLRALRNLAGLEQLGGSARGWLFTVAKRIVGDSHLSVGVCFVQSLYCSSLTAEKASHTASLV